MVCCSTRATLVRSQLGNDLSLQFDKSSKEFTSMAARALRCWRDSPSSGIRSWGPPKIKVLELWPSLIMSPTLPCRTPSVSA